MQALSPRWAVLAVSLVLTSCTVLARDREFDYGRDLALQGTPWRNSPPGYAAPQGHIAQQ